MKSERGGIFFKLIFLIFLVLFCAALYAVRHPLLRAFAHAWITSDPIERGDALIVLSDDNYEGQRAAFAAALYKQGMAPVLVASGRRLRRFAGIAELIQHDLEEHGVPKKAVILFPHSAGSTKEEAEVLAPLVRQRGWHHVIVVTSHVDARRARYILLRVFPGDVDVRVAGAVDEDFDEEHWWENRRSLKRMFHETLGMIVAMWELRGKRNEHEVAQFLVGVERLSPQYIV